MPAQYGRFNWLARIARVTLIVALVAIAASFVLTIAYGILRVAAHPTVLDAGPFVVAVVVEAAAALTVIVAYGVVLALAANHEALSALNGHMRRLQSVLQASQEQLKTLTDLGSLSDQAKAMVYRDREIEAVQEVVHACLLRQDYAHAEALISRLAEQGGYDQEARRLREDVANSRAATREGKVAAAVERVNQTIEQKNWARAQREAQRLAEAFPDNELVAALGGRIVEKQNEHKSQLLQRYDAAVTRNDVDGSIELLRELDRYLSPPEAAALKESARGVFRAKLHNLGVQFAIAVTEERWEQAATTGMQIIQEYPNSRMAEEVRQKLDALHQLAGNNTPAS